jgi:adenylylsulfate kinase
MINNNKVIWFTGLSGSGKTTLAIKLRNHLVKKKYTCVFLDGDELRAGLCSDLNFSQKDRLENIRRVAEIAAIMLKQNDYVIVATISPNNIIRNLAKKIIGSNYFVLVYLSTSLSTCISRDVKGHYKQALKGKIKNFTGIGSDFTAPKSFKLKIDTSKLSIHDSVAEIEKLIDT